MTTWWLLGDYLVTTWWLLGDHLVTTRCLLKDSLVTAWWLLGDYFVHYVKGGPDACSFLVAQKLHASWDSTNWGMTGPSTCLSNNWKTMCKALQSCKSSPILQIICNPVNPLQSWKSWKSCWSYLVLMLTVPAVWAWILCSPGFVSLFQTVFPQLVFFEVYPAYASS